MKTYCRSAGLLFAAIVIMVQVSLVRSEKKFQCNGHEITLSQTQVDGMKKCAESAGVKSMEEMSPEKIPCFTKCVMETAGLVDDAGKPHKENIMRDIDASVPENMKTAYKTAVEKCIDEHGTHISPKDETCLSYSPLAMCVTKAFKTICQG